MPSFLMRKKTPSPRRQWFLVTLGVALGFTLSQIHGSLHHSAVSSSQSTTSTSPQMKHFDDPASLASFAVDYHPTDSDHGTKKERQSHQNHKPSKKQRKDGPVSSKHQKETKPKRNDRDKKRGDKHDKPRESSKAKDSVPAPISKDTAEDHEHKKVPSHSSGNQSTSHVTKLEDPRTPQLLDFAIVGFAKCATSYMTHWLAQQTKHISISSEEVCHLNKQEPDKLLHYLQDTLDSSKMRGFRCPSHFTRTKLNWYRDYFPKTKLIVGLRHPVLWLESFYNYRLRHPKHGNFTLPTNPNDLMGRSCHSSFQGVCLELANFHQALARLAKTPLSPEEQALVHLPVRDLPQLASRKVENPVFVYELRQLNHESFAKDVAAFLGLPNLQPYHESSKKKTKAFDICQDLYRPLRDELMIAARESSQWIRTYFLPHITVSNPDTFVELLKDWELDPCDGKASAKQEQK